MKRYFSLLLPLCILFSACTTTPGGDPSVESEVAPGEALTISKLAVPFKPDEKPYCVSLTEDGKLLVYQTPRPDGHGKLDLWFSRFENGRWSDPYNAGPNINSSANEADGKFSADGSTLVFVRSENFAKSTQLYISHFQNGSWTKAEFIGPPVSDLETREFGASFSRDGKRLYFSSNREGGQGGMDHYYSERIGDKWGEPVNLGPGINTDGDENDMTISANSDAIIFPSRQPDSIAGSTDLYISRLENNAWSEIKNLGPRINTPGNDSCPWLGFDGHTLYLNTQWEGLVAGGQSDSNLVWKFEYSQGF